MTNHMQNTFPLHERPILRHWFGLIGLMTCLVTSASSQQPSTNLRPEPPPGTLLKAAPTYSQWTIAFSYPQDRARQAKDTPLPPLEPNLVRKVVTTKTGNMIHEETLSVSGALFDKWQVDSLFYIKPPGQSYWGECDDRYVKNNRTSDTNLAFLPEKGFRDLDWVSGETYVGVVKQNDTVFLLFVPATAGTLDFSNPVKIQAQPIVAYVDAETRLPALFKKGGVIQNYIFSAPPANIQSLPADLAKQIKDGSERRAKLFGAPKQEY